MRSPGQSEVGSFNAITLGFSLEVSGIRIFIGINHNFVVINVSEFWGFIFHFVDLVAMIDTRNDMEFCRFSWKLYVNDSKRFQKYTFKESQYRFIKKPCDFLERK